MSKKIELSPFYATLLELISNGSSPAPLNQIIENFFHEKSVIPIEKTLMESFPLNDFIELGLLRYYPKMGRGLPRVYLKDHPFQWQIKKHFTNLASLKKQALSKALFSLYAQYRAFGKVTIFTYVMNDGMGDFIAAVEVMRLIRSRLLDLDIHLVAVVQQDALKHLHFPSNTIVVPYDDQVPLISFEAFCLLAESDLILQLPTFYPYTNELKGALPNSRWEMVGEYGFVESSWFHPESGRFSLGLHFLEKGVLTRRACFASWDDIQNERLKKWRVAENRFYLAYLTTTIGGAIYLHSLLKSLENDSLNVDICTPDLRWFISFAQKQMLSKRPILAWDVGVKKIEVYFENMISKIEIAPQGKTVRLLCPGSISQSDFRALLALSGEWVAVRGDQSFSEAVSQRKAFFYDGREHARYFLKDFGAVAENRIGAYQGTLECVRGMLQGFCYNLSVQETNWVDETYFQELEDWTAIALKMGLALQDPDTVSGFKKLGGIITEEFSANSFLCHLLQRALCHKDHPYIEQLEAMHLERFVQDEMNLKELIKELRVIIQSCQKQSAVG